MMTCKCENARCGELFEPKAETIPTENGGEYRWFACPRCGTKYPIATISAYGLRVRDLLAHLQGLLKDRPDYMPRVKELQRALARETRPA